MNVLMALAVGMAAQSAALCGQWEETGSGTLDAALINEASGLEVAAGDATTLYHVNDSGDAGRFYVTRADGTGTRVVTIAGFNPVDTEDLTLGDCGDGGECLFIADIGDNEARRESVEIVVVRLGEWPGDVAAPERRIRFEYEDGPRDAESIALLPNGDLLILTKEPDYARLSAGASGLYRLPIGSRVALRTRDLELREISSDPFSGSLPTAMDLSPDGRRLLVLTYLNAFEFVMDELGVPSVADGAYREIPLRPLQQQESVAYLADGSFVYTTEAGGPDGVPVVRMSCASDR